MKKLLAPLAVLFVLFAAPALANNCPTYPYTLTNGQTADANQVMANFNSILSCANSSLQASNAQAGGGQISGPFSNMNIVIGSITAADLTAGAAVSNIGYTPFDAGGTIPAAALETFYPSTTGSASINIPQGATPNSPNNGDIWTTSVGAYVRINGSSVLFANPSAAAVTSFNTRTGAITLTSADVTTALTYTPLKPSNNLSDVSSAATARTNLGLGTAATAATGTSGATLCLLNTACTAGTPWSLGSSTATTQAANDNSTKVATTAYVATATTGFASTIKYFVITDQQANGVDSGESLTGSSWTKRTLNTTVVNTAGVSLASNQITIPAGTYSCDIEAETGGGGTSSTFNSTSRLYNVTGSATLGDSPAAFKTSTSGAGTFNALHTTFVLGGSTVVELDSYPSTTISGGTDQGNGDANIYGHVSCIKIG